MSDSQVIHNINEDNFDDIVKEYQKHIYNYILRTLGEPESASDLTQEVFLKCWIHRKKFDSKKSSFKTWLYTVTKRTTIDHMRKWRNRKKYEITYAKLNENNGDDSQIEDQFIDTEPLPDTIFENTTFKEIVWQSLKDIGPKYEEVLSLYFESNLSLSEIALVLNKSENTVKSLHRRGILELKSRLKTHPKLND